MTVADYSQILALAVVGYDVPEIAARVGAHTSTVRRCLQAVGVWTPQRVDRSDVDAAICDVLDIYGRAMTIDNLVGLLGWHGHVVTVQTVRTQVRHLVKLGLVEGSTDPDDIRRRRYLWRLTADTDTWLATIKARR